MDDKFGSILVTMWNDIATKSPTKAEKRVHVKNSTCEYSPYKKRTIVKVNELDAIQVYRSFKLILILLILQLCIMEKDS